MNIKLNGKIAEVTDADLADIDETLMKVSYAVAELELELHSELVKRADAREAYLERLIRFCHTGK